MERIIENALGSIRAGLEDYQRAKKEANDARFTSAVRNVFAGILLLAKGKLYELSPTDNPGILIRVIRPKLIDDRLQMVADGKSTINYIELKRRFADFELSLNWRNVDQMQKIRNDLEHFYHAGTGAQVQQALADVTPTVHELLRLLQLDPVRDLGEEWWKVLLENEEVFRAELKECHSSLASVDWINSTARKAAIHLSCPDCGSSLVCRPDQSEDNQEDLQLACRACGSSPELSSVMEGALEWLFPSDISDPPEDCSIAECPECTHSTYIRDTGECAMCNFTMSEDDASCGICDDALSMEEYQLHPGICSYHAYVMAKDD
jgi:hypothetical protein